MRSIEFEKDKEKSNKKKQAIVAIVLVSIMFLSVLGYGVGNWSGEKQEKLQYNEFEFFRQDSLWLLQIEDLKFSFKYNPTQVEKIDSEVHYLNDYYGQVIYIDSIDNYATIEIARNLDPRVNAISKRIQTACIEGKTCADDTPIKTCNDTLIVVKEAETPKITQDERCVFIEGPKEKLVEITDEFLFKVLNLG